MKLLQKSYQKILLLFLCVTAMLISKRYQAEDNGYLLQSSDQNKQRLGAEKPNITDDGYFDKLGAFYYHQRQYDNAIEFYQKSLNMYLSIYRDKPHANIAISYHNLGIVYYDKEAYDKSFEYFKKSLDMYKKIYGDKPHLDIANAYHNLRIVSIAQEEYAQCLTFYEKYLKVVRKLPEKDRPPF